MKKAAILISTVFISLVCHSQPVDINLAKKVAKNFYAKKYGHSTLKSANVDGTKGKEVKNTIEKKYKGHNSYYINNIDGGGWVVVSSHKAMGPVLAHSPKGTLVEGEIPPVFWDWMEQYEILIDSAYQKNWKNKEKEKKWEALEKDSPSAPANLKSYTVGTWLLDTQWGQTASSDGQCPGFNDWMKSNTVCPSRHCNKCPAGCVAVAVAQIMNYWGYATGDSADFDWWDMPSPRLTHSFGMNPNYDAEQRAVSYLMKRCGDRLSMKYCKDGNCASSTNSEEYGEYAFREFGYADEMNYERKGWHTYNAWVNMLKDEINAERPVFYLYRGSHTFVCDGHDGDNTFHFNLGWNSQCDGWYDFEDLKSSNCPGPCNTDFDFTGSLFNHHCIIGIRPDASASLTLKNISISSGSKTYQAKSNIAAAGDNSYFHVNNNAKCRFVAGTGIRLEPGFHAKSGSSFHSKIYKKPSLKSSPVDANNPISGSFSSNAGDNKTGVFSIYPNPTDGYLLVSSETYMDSGIQISVHNMVGETIYRFGGYFTGKHEINMGNIPKGLYFVKIQHNNDCYSYKILKQ